MAAVGLRVWVQFGDSLHPRMGQALTLLSAAALFSATGTNAFDGDEQRESYITTNAYFLTLFFIRIHKSRMG